MGDNKSLEPFFNDDVSESGSETGKRDLRVKSGVDPIEGYRMSDSEINMGTNVTNYYGFLRDTGAYYIARQIISGVLTAWTYSKGDSGYAAAWTGRETEGYQRFSDEF